jgi:uncharacterized protein involved in response to NO
MAIPRYRSADNLPLLSAGFRPFFLAAGLWACLSMTLWILMLRGMVQLPTAFSAVVWHFHELLFGFIAAAIAGFLLTAIPNWTGRLPLQGWPLGALVLLWLAGRVAVAFSALIGPAVAMTVDLAFLVVFAAVVGREILAGRNWRNLPVVVALSFLIGANALMHAELTALGERLSISVVIVLISLIGGRIIPSFTANWLRRREADSFPAPFGPFDRATLAISIIALAAWVIMGLVPISGVALIIAALAHAIRLARWRGGATLEEPLVTILHLGYAWVPIGLGLLGSSAWFPSLATSAIHALTVGAMGTMILAVMTRASLGHSKRELTAGLGTSTAYALALGAAAVRVAAPYSGAAYAGALDLAAGLWIAAFLLFVALYFPLYVHR